MDMIVLARQTLDKKAEAFAREIEKRAEDLGVDGTALKRALRPIMLEMLDKYFPE